MECRRQQSKVKTLLLQDYALLKFDLTDIVKTHMIRL